MKPTIYFYLPVLDEQQTVGVFLYRLGEVMRDSRLDYEVFLTLDGCTDDSAAVVEPYLKRMPLRVTHNEKRLGYGKSLLDTVNRVASQSANPKRDFFLVMDADFSLDPLILNDMLDGMERNVDFYTSDRFSAGAKSVSLSKRLAQRFARTILHFRGAQAGREPDYFSTLRGCRLHLLRRNLERLKPLGELGPGVQPAAAALVLLLALYRGARNPARIKIQEKKLRRRKSRFALLALLRWLLFGRQIVSTAAAPEAAPESTRPPRRRYPNKNRRRSSKSEAGS
ncbi:MAG: hypothetical protein A2Z86_10820 [Candidatus Glassbacteria bacterium GWA2_58_10]|uniref:Glycosyltransferase 2-like domain-containing protein n=1 Tax=Candidatus Glassbacteria bacterium GWA2_58_10 TaxID=1817865 RepID=A0A1F5Y9Z7_9BACT|nr:MAG: hypothetical protein A2Z86_10820 [Candidatus Glassbacteria bacterium GWA2_58_10]